MGTKPSDFDIFESYIEPMRRKLIACSLLTFGARQFKTATIIKRLDEIDNLYKNHDNNYVLNNFPNLFPDVLFENLLDTIRINICFENYFKAKLLFNGFAIHNINKDENKMLFQKQKKNPVEISELIPKKSPMFLPQLKKCLQESTINYSTILGCSAYHKYFNIQNDSLDFLIVLNKQRNRLHLHLGELTTLSRKIIGHYKMLRSIVDMDIAILQNTLLNELDPQSKSKLPVRLFPDVEIPS